MKDRKEVVLLAQGSRYEINNRDPKPFTRLPWALKQLRCLIAKQRKKEYLHYLLKRRGNCLESFQNDPSRTSQKLYVQWLKNIQEKRENTE